MNFPCITQCAEHDGHRNFFMIGAIYRVRTDEHTYIHTHAHKHHAMPINSQPAFSEASLTLSFRKNLCFIILLHYYPYYIIL